MSDEAMVEILKLAQRVAQLEVEIAEVKAKLSSVQDPHSRQRFRDALAKQDQGRVP